MPFSRRSSNLLLLVLLIVFALDLMYLNIMVGMLADKLP